MISKKRSNEKLRSIIKVVINKKKPVQNNTQNHQNWTRKECCEFQVIQAKTQKIKSNQIASETHNAHIAFESTAIISYLIFACGGCNSVTSYTYWIVSIFFFFFCLFHNAFFQWFAAFAVRNTKLPMLCFKTDSFSLFLFASERK